MENFPKESTEEDAHYIDLPTNGDELETHDVYKLIAEAKDTLPIKLEMEDWQSELEWGWWKDKNGLGFTPNYLLKLYAEIGTWEGVKAQYPELSDHIQRVVEADLSHPILIYNHDVVDGMHRLVKAITEHAPEIYAKIATPSELTQLTI